jgi:hypothetical protein
VPGFYRLLQAQDAAKQAEYAGELTAEVRGSTAFPRDAAFLLFYCG